PAMNRHARKKILGHILPRVRSVCDLGCGIGSTALELARRGLRVYGVDLSREMCRLARAKLRQAPIPVRVICADMRSFRLPEQVDVVLCEFNPINHLTRQSDILPTFRRVYRALRPGGWFYFDLNTCRTYRAYYGTTRVEEGPGYYLVLRSGFDPRRRKGWLDFDWFVSEGRIWRRYRERVEDACWSDAEIRAALRAAGFTRLRSWDGARVRPRSLHPKPGYDAYYLAQKAATP
ncbi:MAG: class I SAM-dependent methyltransferase, partial [Candidatus Acidiferrales bacterium]